MNLKLNRCGVRGMAFAMLWWPSVALSQDVPPAGRDQQEPARKSQERLRRPPRDHDHTTYQGRPIADVMSYLGADWLVRPERIEEEMPDAMLAALEIQPGWTVADVGAGVGYHSLRIARLVGPKGRVLATDVQPQMLQMLRQNLRESGVRNVIPILCMQTDPKLPEGEVDLVLMVDVYHEMSEPGPSIAAIRKALKPNGKLVLVEFRGEDPEVPIKPEHKMTVVQVKKEMAALGFQLETLHDFLPWQHILVFEKSRDETPTDAAQEAASETREGEQPPAADPAEKDGPTR